MFIAQQFKSCQSSFFFFFVLLFITVSYSLNVLFNVNVFKITVLQCRTFFLHFQPFFDVQFFETFEWQFHVMFTLFLSELSLLQLYNELFQGHNIAKMVQYLLFMEYYSFIHYLRATSTPKPQDSFILCREEYTKSFLILQL